MSLPMISHNSVNAVLWLVERIKRPSKIDVSSVIIVLTCKLNMVHSQLAVHLQSGQDEKIDQISLNQ